MPGTRIQWDVSGVVVGESVVAHTMLAGVPIASDFQLYADGRPKMVHLGEAPRVQGHDLPGSAEVWFRADGTIERAKYVEKHGFMIHREPWRDTATVEYDRSGAKTGKDVQHWQSDVRPPQLR